MLYDGFIINREVKSRFENIIKFKEIKVMLIKVILICIYWIILFCVNKL